MMSEEFLADKEFYYCTYAGIGFGGAIVIPQHKMPGGSENPDGFNIAAATEHLLTMFGQVMIVQSWHLISRRRRDEFESFVARVTQAAPEPKNNVTHLRLVQPDASL